MHPETPRAGDPMAELKPVTQADRDTAANALLALQMGGLTPRAIRASEGDSHRFVQAFAAHRIAHSAPAREVTPAMIEAVEAAIADPGRYCGFRGDRGMSYWQAEPALRALYGQPVSATPPPARGREDGDMKARARELLAAEFDKIAGEHDAGGHVNAAANVRRRAADIRQGQSGCDGIALRAIERALSKPVLSAEVGELCDDCPPVGYPTDKTRCLPCPRRRTFEEGIEAAAGWHDQRYRDTPDAFEMEFHDVSRKAIRALADPDIRLESDYG